MDDNTDPIVQEYAESWEKYGATAKGVGWLDDYSQQIRWGVIYEMLRAEFDVKEKPDLLDVGCGYGGFLYWMEFWEEARFRYTGIDFCEPMIKYAQENVGSAVDVKFLYDNFLTAPALPNTYDMVVCSGAMNYQNHNLFQFVRKMWEVSRGVVVFNLLVLGDRADTSIGARLARMVGAERYAVERGYLKLQGYTDITVKLWKQDTTPEFYAK